MGYVGSGVGIGRFGVLRGVLVFVFVGVFWFGVGAVAHRAHGVGWFVPWVQLG